MQVSEISVGDRVELHPASDVWMMGERFAEIRSLVRETEWIGARGERSGLRFRLRIADILRLAPAGKPQEAVADE